MLRVASGLIIVVVLSAVSSSSDAAVRSCKPIVIAAAREAADELTAKKLALESWLGLAQQSGPGYTRWELAHRRALACRRLASGQYQCQAGGAPCTIVQAPGNAPAPDGKAPPPAPPVGKGGKSIHL